MVFIDFRPGTPAASRLHTLAKSGVAGGCGWRRQARPLARLRSAGCLAVILANFQRRGTWFSLIFIRARPRQADRRL